MLQDPKDIVNIWQQELVKASTEIVKAKLAGEMVEEISVDVTIQIPKPLLQAIVTASEATGSDPDDILSEMASQGFHSSLNSQISPSVQSTAPAASSTSKQDPMAAIGQLKGLGIDVSSIEGKMSEFANMMGMLNQMKEKMQDVERQFSDDDGTDSEDTE